MKKLGFIINPIAGMGGRVGLKGTDAMAETAAALGAAPTAGLKAERALSRICAPCIVLTCQGQMGEACARGIGINPVIIENNMHRKTTAAHTIAAAKKMMSMGADLILFAGGDGTARDICRAVGEKIPVTGIPAGVKIHSPVFAKTPEKAGGLAHDFLEGRIHGTCAKEVMDIDENACRKGRVVTRLHGYLTVPDGPGRLQSRKTGSSLTEKAAQDLIGLYISDNMIKNMIYLVGPGTTTRTVMENLHIDGTLLGVDIICNKKMIHKDANEKDILKFTTGKPFKIIITPVGGQGCLFGRGNLQISPEIIKAAGIKNIIVASTAEKIAALQGVPLMVDTGDLQVDHMLSGYIHVITGYNETRIYRVQYN